MERKVGTISGGARCPTVHGGGNLAAIVSQGVLSAAEVGGLEPRDRDTIVIAESIVARAQGNYAPANVIAAGVKGKLGEETIGVMFPVPSHNRFAICLKGIIKGARKIIPMLSYPSDEAGNGLVSIDKLGEAGTSPYNDVLSLETYRKLFGENRHELAEIDHVSYYSDLIRSCSAKMEIIFANHPKEILECTKNVLTCDIHIRARAKHILKANSVERVCDLDDIVTTSVDGSGYDEALGLLGPNESAEDMVKLFPRSCQPLVRGTQKQVLQTCGKHVEVMVYSGDALRGPVRKIWELAGPCVSPAYTSGLEGTPNELKLKYLVDSDFTQLEGEELQKVIEAEIREKEDNLVGNMASQGTIPGCLTDLIGSLCNLASGSGGKGTPIIFVQGYFGNSTNQRANNWYIRHHCTTMVFCRARIKEL